MTKSQSENELFNNDCQIEEWIASLGNIVWDEDIQNQYVSNNEYLVKHMDDRSLKIHILERLDKLELSLKSIMK